MKSHDDPNLLRTRRNLKAKEKCGAMETKDLSLGLTSQHYIFRPCWRLHGVQRILTFVGYR